MGKKYKRNAYEMLFEICAAWSAELVLGQQEHSRKPYLENQNSNKMLGEKKEKK